MGEVDMKKVFLFLTIILVTCCFYSCGKNEKNEQGTYIPLKMYETVKETKSYYEGIKATYDAKFYTVLCVKEDGIYSNEKFHDAYKLNPSEIDFTFSSKNKIIDNETGIEYIKISDSIDYYSAYDKFLADTVIKAIAKKNKKLTQEDSKVLFNNKEYNIDKDQWHYSENLQIILYTKTSKSYFYIGFVDFKPYALKDAEELKMVVDYEIK